MAKFNEIECMKCHKFFKPSDKNRNEVLTEDHTITCPHCGQHFQLKADDVSWIVEGTRTLDVPNHLSSEEKIAAEEAKKKFFDYLDSLPDADLTDPKVLAGIKSRLASKIHPEIEQIDNAQAKTAGRAFTMWVR